MVHRLSNTQDPRRWEMGRLTRFRGALVILVTAVALLAAGCGGGNDNQSASGQQSSGGLKDLVTSGTLTVSTELPAPPFWIGNDYDSITGGYEVDLAKEIAKRLNIANVKFVEMPFAGLGAGQKCKCQIDAVLRDTPIVLGAIKAGQVKDAAVVGQFKTGEEYGAVLNKGSPNVAAINNVLNSLKSEGFTDQLFKKYFGTDPTSVPTIS